MSLLASANLSTELRNKAKEELKKPEAEKR